MDESVGFTDRWPQPALYEVFPGISLGVFRLHVSLLPLRLVAIGRNHPPIPHSPSGRQLREDEL